MLTLRKLPECPQCQFHARSPYVVCAVHPNGPKSDRCLDFRLDPQIPIESFAPAGYSWYGGDLIKAYPSQLLESDRINLLETHPLFTGCCPECDRVFVETPQVHWDCDRCGWKDDSVN